MPLPSEPYLVYLDSTFLVDLADSNERRHGDAEIVLDLFKYHQSSQLLQVRASMWTVAEAQSILYKNACIRSGMPEDPDPRKTLPPIQSQLSASQASLLSIINTLMVETTFQFLPDTTSDSNQFWVLVNKIGRETLAFAPDCVHLAFAIEGGCSLLITDDKDFYEKITYCLVSAIEPQRNAIHSLITLPPFQVGGVQRKYMNRRRVETALEILRNKGF